MNDSAGHHLLATLRGGLVVSCQANPGEPFRDSESMGKFASSAHVGGAVGVRTEGLSDIALIHELISLPQIGLWKTDDIENVFITPTVEHALAVAHAGAEIVAIDGTRRPRPDGKTLRETIDAIRENTGVLVMADTATFDDAEFSISAGADMISTALSGYTLDSAKRGDGPDLELVRAITESFDTPVFAEGRFRTPAQAAKAIALGAHAVVVGAAITDPIAISSWFVDAMKEAAP
jgi:N-acylglucosamine-6-phosphate 2-epimerase